MEFDIKQYFRVGGIFTAVTLSLTLAGWVAVAGAAPPASGKAKSKPVASQPPVAPASAIVNDNTPLTEEQKILHVLNRLGFGPRPGDAEKVRQLGLSQYIARQLDPVRIDDSAVENKLRNLTILQESNTELARLYQLRQSRTAKLIKAREKMEKAGTTQEQMQAEVQNGTMEPAEMRRKTVEAYRSLTPEEQADLRELRAAQQKVREAGLQLATDKIVRAVESERQLQEVLVDFWSNHFNIDLRKGPCAVYKISDERDVVRKNIFGKFRNILGASAKSPAMLFYLDNAQSQAPKAATQREQRREAFIKRMAEQGNEQAKYAMTIQANRGKRGINENYAREIMELHSLGVDGGYTQKDVQEVARCLTGWTINRRTGEFQFDRNRHDDGEKMVLGQLIPANGGMQDGEKVLDLLASHPSTMRFISTKLCRRFVADDPPASLVNKCIATWKRTDGDLREIYRTIFTSPEFYSRAAYRQKIKSPFEYAVSSARALGATFQLASQSTRLISQRPNANQGRTGVLLNRTIGGQIATMGQPLYQFQAPTGYPEDSRKWVSSGALISRLNFALSLAGGRMMDVQLALPEGVNSGDTAQTVNLLTDRLLHGEVSPSTRATLLKQATTAPSDVQLAAETDASTRLIALVLGSPEFQRR